MNIRLWYQRCCIFFSRLQNYPGAFEHGFSIKMGLVICGLAEIVARVIISNMYTQTPFFFLKHANHRLIVEDGFSINMDLVICKRAEIVARLMQCVIRNI